MLSRLLQLCHKRRGVLSVVLSPGLGAHRDEDDEIYGGAQAWQTSALELRCGRDVEGRFEGFPVPLFTVGALGGVAMATAVLPNDFPRHMAALNVPKGRQMFHMEASCLTSFQRLIRTIILLFSLHSQELVVVGVY